MTEVRALPAPPSRNRRLELPSGSLKGQKGNLVTGGSIAFVGDGAASSLIHVLTLRD